MKNGFGRTVRRVLLTGLLIAALLLMSVGSLPLSAATRISPEPTFVPGQATLTELRAFFQNGAYWNHISGTEDTPYSVTDTPCSAITASDGLHKDEGVVCNFFEIPGKVWGGWQCCGFTRLMTYLYFGTSCENWETSTSLVGMKAGDVLYLTNGGPHYVWLLSVTDNGDGTQKVTYTDCNGAGRRAHCQIQWDARCTVNMKTQELELASIGTWDVFKRYVSPGGARTVLPESYAGSAGSYAVTYSDGQGQSSTPVAATGDLTLGACSFRRAGYTFAGWTVQRHSDGAWLCGNAWTTDVNESATDFPAGTKLTAALFASGETYDVVADWTKNVLTVRYAPNGGQFTDAAYGTDATGVICCKGKPIEDEWTYSAPADPGKLPDADDWGLMRSGYTFVGWSLAPQNKTTMTEADVTARLAAKSGEETWYAVWVPNMVEVWYRTDDGVVESDAYQMLGNGRIVCRDHIGWALTRLFTGGTTPLLTADELGLKRDGYTFVGWTANGKSVVSTAAVRRMATNLFRTRVELTAVWEENKEPETSTPENSGPSGPGPIGPGSENSNPETSTPETSTPENSGPSGPSGPVNPKKGAAL